MIIIRSINRLRCIKATKLRALFEEVEPEGRPFRSQFYGEGADEFILGREYDIDFRLSAKQ